MAAKTWSLKGWKKGQVSLFQAFGLRTGSVSFPKLQAQLPSQVGSGSSGNTSASKGGAAGGSNKAVGNAALRGPAASSITGKAPANAPQYTKGQLEQLWIQAGGSPSKANVAAAIAEAESSGRSGATNHNTNGSVDRGLWQINSVHGAQSTYNPLANAKSAVAISGNGSNWSPWTTYNTGAYRRYL